MLASRAQPHPSSCSAGQDMPITDAGSAGAIHLWNRQETKLESSGHNTQRILIHGQASLQTGCGFRATSDFKNQFFKLVDCATAVCRLGFSKRTSTSRGAILTSTNQIAASIHVVTTEDNIRMRRSCICIYGCMIYVHVCTCM